MFQPPPVPTSCGPEALAIQLVSSTLPLIQQNELANASPIPGAGRLLREPPTPALEASDWWVLHSLQEGLLPKTFSKGGLITTMAESQITEPLASRRPSNHLILPIHFTERTSHRESPGQFVANLEIKLESPNLVLFFFFLLHLPVVSFLSYEMRINSFMPQRVASKKNNDTPQFTSVLQFANTLLYTFLPRTCERC